MQPQHVPAWKKLGLKLKYAKESRDISQAATARAKRELHENGHNQISDPASDSSAPTKKRRVEISSVTPQTNGIDSRVLSPSLKKGGSMALKKRVSFTAETKTLDGDSSKSMIAAWEVDHSAPEDFIQFHEAVAREEAELAAKAELEIPKKRKAKKELKRTKEVKSAPRKSTDALDYLQQFQDDRRSWKFNKNREVWILKNILSLDDIPASYDSALAGYVQGLKSEGAKSRLTEQCSKVVSENISTAPPGEGEIGHEEHQSNKDGESTMDDPDRRKAYHDAAKERYKRKVAESQDDQRKADEPELLEYQKRKERRRRAKLLLENIQPPQERSNGSVSNGNVHPQRIVFGNDEFTNEPSGTLANRTRNGMTQRKKRKSRTAIVVSDSSSDSSSDTDGDSESDSDSSEDKPRSKRSPTSSSPSLLIGLNTSSESESTTYDDSGSSSDSEDSSSEKGPSSGARAISVITIPDSTTSSHSRHSSRSTQRVSSSEDADSTSDSDDSDQSSSSDDSDARD